MKARPESSVYISGIDEMDGMRGSADAWRTMPRSETANGRSTTGGDDSLGTRSGGAKASGSNLFIGA
jgi:hypothetical protein